MARPRVPIDWAIFEKLCLLHCTQIEIASFMHISVDTLDRGVKRKYKKGFAEVYAEKAAGGKTSLRKAMWDKALNGKDNTMMIWLSKNHLGMSDKHEERVIQEKPSEVKIIWQSMPGAPTLYDTKGRQEPDEEEDGGLKPLDSLD
jgi:hypothetical protein